jgi:hypothetical protein
MRSGVPGVADVVVALVGCDRVVDRAKEAFDLVLSMVRNSAARNRALILANASSIEV